MSLLKEIKAGLAIACALAALATASCVVKKDSGGEVVVTIVPPGPPIDFCPPGALDDNHIAQVIRLRIEPDFLKHVSEGVPAACDHCVVFGRAVRINQQDGLDLNPAVVPSDMPAIKKGLPAGVWQTPLDVDVMGIQPDQTQPAKVILKIVLADPMLQFYTKFPSTVSGNLEDSEWAVRPGDKHPKMFICRGPIVHRVTGDYIKLLMDYKFKDVIGVVDGFNVGVMSKVGTVRIPIYIDPNTKSNGVD